MYQLFLIIIFSIILLVLFTFCNFAPKYKKIQLLQVCDLSCCLVDSIRLYCADIQQNNKTTKQQDKLKPSET